MKFRNLIAAAALVLSALSCSQLTSQRALYEDINLRLSEARGVFAIPPTDGQVFVPVADGRVRWPVGEHRRLFRFDVESQKTETKLLEVYRVLVDRVEVYYRDASGQWHTAASGRAVPSSERSVNYQYPAFFLPLVPGKNVFYVHVLHEGTLVLPLRLWNTADFMHETNWRDMIEGAHYGALGLLVLYHLAMFLVIREKDFLLYFFAMLGHLFIHMTLMGTGSLYFWQGTFELNRRLPFVAHSLLLIATAVFARSFFRLKSRSPFLHDGLTSILVLGGLLLPASMMFDYLTLTYLHYGVNLYGQTVAFATLVFVMMRGDRMLRLFIVARLCMSAGDISFMMRELGLLSWGFSAFDRLFIYFGSAAASMFLTLIIVERYQKLKVTHEYDLEQLSRRDRFIRHLSHELKAPLAGLRMVLDALKQPGVTEPMKDRMVHMMEESISHHLGFLDEASRLDRLRRPEFAVQSIPVRLASVADRVIAEFEADAKVKQIVLAHRIPADASIRSDPEILTEILRRLVSNSLKYSDAGGQVEIAWQGSELNVIDRGIGMDQSTLSALFDEAGKTRLGTRGEKGYGLGLAFCRAAVERLGGTIRASSSPGGGTRFTLKFGVEN